RRAWINVSRDFLLAGLARILPRTQVVLELLEDQLIDDALIDALEDHRARGYTIALDDYAGSEVVAPALDHADIVKLDVLARERAAIQEDVARLARRGITLLAEKVETREDHEY